MAPPIVSIVGRPNVGKSTLFNRLAETNKAIVHETRGVTRDRSYEKTSWGGKQFILVDTGGIELISQETDQFSAHIRESALQAIDESDVILFMLDAKTGITSEDDHIANILKRSCKPVFVVVNKMDNPENDDQIYEFYQLGLGDPFAVSSLHGHGTGDLLDEVVETLPEHKDEVPEDAVSIALVGRPNVGKSSLLNKLVGSERSVVSNVPGTTRDSIDTYMEADNQLYRFIDTAGIARKAQRSSDLDYYAYVRALRSIDEADICLLLIDAEEGMVEQDQRIAQAAIDRGCAVILLINKWDLLKSDDYTRDTLDQTIERRTQGMKWIPHLGISALTGRSVDKILPMVDEVAHKMQSRISTAELNGFLQTVRAASTVPSDSKRRLKVYYGTQTGTNPPFITIFCNYPRLVNAQYERFVEGALRDAFDFEGVPIKLKFKQRNV